MGEAQKSPIMKKTRENQQKLQVLANAVGPNGKLVKETLDRSLDRMLKAAHEINRELNELRPRRAADAGVICLEVPAVVDTSRRPCGC